MDKETRKKHLEELKNTPYGKALLSFLEEEISNIDTVKGARLLSKEEMIGREIALEILEKLFYFMEKNNPQGVKRKVTYS